jgi:hypothetical protein
MIEHEDIQGLSRLRTNLYLITDAMKLIIYLEYLYEDLESLISREEFKTCMIDS